MIYDAPDWAPPFGIPRPAVLPPDDELQDALCAIRAAVANAHHDLFDDAPNTTPWRRRPPATSPLPLPVRSRSSTTATSAGLVEDRTPWTMWSDARL